MVKINGQEQNPIHPHGTKESIELTGLPPDEIDEVNIVSEKVLSERAQIQSEKKITEKRVQSIPFTPHPSAARAKIEQLMQEIKTNQDLGKDPFVIRELKKTIDAYENELWKESKIGWIEHLVAKIFTNRSLTQKAIDFYNSALNDNENLKTFKKSLDNPNTSYQLTNFVYKDRTTEEEIMYSGKIIDGQFSQGNLINRTKDIVYTGSFKNNTFDGHGELLYPTGSIYVGNLKNGKPHGQGKINYPNGETFEGNFVNGVPYSESINTLKDKKNGHGIIIDMNGTSYEGTFKNGKLHGQGKISLIGGTICEGIFENGKPVQGKLTYEDGTIFEGTFGNDGPNEGTLTYTFGETYEGPFKKGEPNGEGKITYPDEARYEGNVENGEPSGKGKKYLPNDVRLEGQFRDGEFISGLKTENGRTTTYKNGKPI